MFRVTNEDIEKLVDKEYEEAIQHGKTYNSDHEFYAVLKEELEEAQDDVDIATFKLQCIWTKIRCNQELEEAIEDLEEKLMFSIQECLQCLAVIKKYKNKEE